MPYYENVFIARQDISSAQIETITDSMVTLIDETGGRVSRREYWGVRSLAYRMKKNKKGHYVLLNFEAPSSTVLEMERQMRLNEDILRILTIKTDDLPEEPSVVMANRGERSRYRDRPERNEERAPHRPDSTEDEVAEKPASETSSEGESA
jgi:small subunit ribosomal protein S6